MFPGDLGGSGPVPGFTDTPNSLRGRRRLVFKVIFNFRICSCLACVYRVMDARRKFGEHERCVRVARGHSRVQL